MDANRLAYTYTVNINVHDETGEIQASVRGEGFGPSCSVPGSGPRADIVDAAFAMNVGAAIAAEFIRDRHGIMGAPVVYGHHTEHPAFTREMWRDEVTAGDVVSGYHDWVMSQIEQEGDDAAPTS